MGMNNSGHNCMCNYLWDINVKTVNRLLPYSTSCVPATIDSFFLYDVGMKKGKKQVFSLFLH